MQELITFAIQHGFSPNEIIPDGKIHRFKTEAKDHKESAYYCFHQNHHSRTGQIFYAGIIGSWKGEEFIYNSAIKMSAAERKLSREKIAASQAKISAEKLKRQEATAIECQEKWETLKEGISPYHTSKGLKESGGARVQEDPFGGIDLYIPMRDIEGKLWSLQKIQSDGGKFFYPGGRVDSCYHVMGELNGAEEIRICEGFATAGSVHEAVGGTVISAFNAGNLVKVARSIKGKYPEAIIIICGDNDQWTTEPDGTPTNPGRTAAEEAAGATLGKAVFPIFSPESLEKRATDFNDLAANEGIERVREQLGAVEAPEKHYVISLGHDGSDYFFLSNVNPQIQRITSTQIAPSLSRLQPIVYWEAVYPGEKGGVNRECAADELMQQCHAHGVFRSAKLRGPGVWVDRSHVVYHRGSALNVDGTEQPLHMNDLKSQYIYDLGDNRPPLHPEPLEASESEALMNLAVSLNWVEKDSWMFFLGWAAVAPLGGALDWRPHLWLTGPSDSGKSWTMENVLRPILKNCSVQVKGASTEAGIRQYCKNSTFPLIFDECETNDDHSAARVRSILELARQASSSSDGIIAKGTVHGTSMQFLPQFCMCNASVRPGLVHVEDKNRFTVLEFLPPSANSKNSSQFERVLKFRAQISEEYGDRMFSRMVRLTPKVKESAKVFQKTIAGMFGHRAGHQFGTLLAGFWMFQHDDVVTAEEAAKLCSALNLSDAKENSEERDEIDALTHLLTTRISIDHSDYSVSEAVRLSRLSDTEGRKLRDALQQLLGLLIRDDGMGVAASHAELESRVYRGTKWSRSWSRALRRVDGASKRALWICGRTVQGTFLPWNKVLTEKPK